MPEGDTILRTAKNLGKAIAGKKLTRVRSAVPAVAAAPLAGKRIREIEARGKNLLIHLEDGSVVYTHLRMAGTWHIYRPGEQWRKPTRLARLVLETADFVAVCFNAPVVEVLDARDVKRHPVLGKLGPDLLTPEFNLGDARRRLRQRETLAVGEALLVQSAVAGIGNVYKSETLFLCGTDPRVRLRQLSDQDLDRILLKAAELMSQNLDGFPRITCDAGGRGRHWVYRRSGRPCRRCGSIIRVTRQGAAGRSTYWCPTCQPETKLGL